MEKEREKLVQKLRIYAMLMRAIEMKEESRIEYAKKPEIFSITNPYKVIPEGSHGEYKCGKQKRRERRAKERAK